MQSLQGRMVIEKFPNFSAILTLLVVTVDSVFIFECEVFV